MGSLTSAVKGYPAFHGVDPSQLTTSEDIVYETWWEMELSKLNWNWKWFYMHEYCIILENIIAI